jgi:hypothetical protein
MEMKNPLELFEVSENIQHVRSPTILKASGGF